MLISWYIGAGHRSPMFLCASVAAWAVACAGEATPYIAAPGRNAASVPAELPDGRSSQDDGANVSHELSLACSVVDASTGRGLPGVRVVTSLVTYVDPRNAPERLTMEKTVIGDCVSAEDGYFAVALDPQTPAGSRCLVAAWSKDWAGYRDFTIEDLQDDGQIDQPWNVLVNARTGMIRLRTVNAHGDRVPACAVLVLPAWGKWQHMRAWFSWPVIECDELVSALGLLAISDRNGNVSLARVPVCEEGPEGGYFAFAFDQRHASLKEWFEEQDVVDGDLGPVMIPVERIETLSLEGVVLDASGDGIQGVTVDVNGAHVADGGESGSWRIDGSMLGAGPWTICFRANGYKELCFTLPHPEYLLLEDAKRVHLTMEKER